MDKPSLMRPGGAPMVRLRLYGEFDIAGLDRLRADLEAALAGIGHGGCLVLDLAGVEFLDCSALGVVLQAARDAAHRQIEVQLVGDRGSVARLLQLTRARRLVKDILVRCDK